MKKLKNKMYSETDIKKKFHRYYKRKNANTINTMGTQGFYPERDVFEIFYMINNIYPKYFDGENFIDIGCGIGNILFALSRFGFKGSISGLEINIEYLNIAKRILSKNICFINADARYYSFSRFDRIYTFNPFQRCPAQAYYNIWDTIRPGTIWLETKSKHMPTNLLNEKRKILMSRKNKKFDAILLFK
jgi:SAM-dependent methyltransferase